MDGGDDPSTTSVDFTIGCMGKEPFRLPSSFLGRAVVFALSFPVGAMALGGHRRWAQFDGRLENERSPTRARVANNEPVASTVHGQSVAE